MSNSNQSMPQFCLVVPCYNEEAVLPRFFQEVLPKLELHTDGSWRAIFIDDGSSDHTWSLLCEKHLQDNRVCGLRLSRNFGHQAALYAGARHATAEFVGFMDSDLQDPPDVLIQLLQKVSGGNCDVCFGIREKRDAPLALRICYRSFYKIISSVADHEWPRDAGDFCVVRGDVLNSILELGEKEWLFRGLRAWVGFRQLGVPYSRPKRQHGKSKYGLFRLMSLATKSFVGFSSLPLRLATLSAIAMGLLSFLFGIFVLVNRFYPSFTLFGFYVGTSPGTTAILLWISITSAMTFAFFGILGEYMNVILKEVKGRPRALIKEIVGDIGPRVQ